MFYEGHPAHELHFGDVVKGFICSDLIVEEPILAHPSKGYDYKIDLKVPTHSVILTPSCSIEKSVFILSPLREVLSDFFKNPLYKQDLTNINRLVLPANQLPPDDWKELRETDKQAYIEKGPGYAHKQYFIYEQHELFEEYTRKGTTTRYYMIDFKCVQRIKCKLIQRKEPHPVTTKQLIKSKILQLTSDTRKELGEKLAAFYGRA